MKISNRHSLETAAEPVRAYREVFIVEICKREGCSST